MARIYVLVLVIAGALVKATEKNRGEPFHRLESKVDNLTSVVESQEVVIQDLNAELEAYRTVCDWPPSIDHSDVTVTSTTFASVAVYSCHGGYEASGSTLIQCMKGGTWSPTDLECTIKCPTELRFSRDVNTNLCYRLSGFSDIVSHDTAADNCNTDGSRLMVLDDEEKYNFLYNLLESLGSAAYQPDVSRYRIWVGMTKQNSVFLWNNGNDYVKLWGAGEPDWHVAQDCVQFLDDGFSDVYCSSERRYMCEIPMQ